VSNVERETVDPLRVETSGETVGEAKWQALRELERMRPGLDKTQVRFQVVSEGERGLLGVGYTPARVVATLDDASAAAAIHEESETAAAARALVERAASALGVRCRVDVREDDDVITVSCSGEDLGILIGKRGQTIDAIQYLVNATRPRRQEAGAKSVVVDAAGYRARREATLKALAIRSAERSLATGAPVELEPMSAAERRVVHLRLKDFRGVRTASAGAEPKRYVVVTPETRGSGTRGTDTTD
jgi:spoIIIJ-associated protein